MLKALSEDFEDYAGKTITFEKTVENARDKASKSYEDFQVEMEVIDGSITYRVEVKNCADCVTSSVIKNQFIDRDLYNATSIGQIRWKIYEQDFSQADLNTLLISNKSSVEALGIQKVEQLFPDLKNQFNDSNYADFLIEKLNEKKVFDAIFKKN